MPNFTFNVAKGRVAELHNRVKNADPANCGLVLVPLEAAGIETDAVLKDKMTLADVLAGTTNAQTTMGRKVFLAADLAALPAPDHANDRNERSLPVTTYTAPAGNALGAFLVCFDPDTTAGDDSSIVPLTKFDFAFTPGGIDLELAAAVYFRAQEAA